MSQPAHRQHVRTAVITGRRTLFPPIEPYMSGTLKVSDIHTLHFEQCGNPNGRQTVVVVHGGPGAGCSATMRQFFDPEAYRIILFDQRGAGKSTPHAELRENTTWDLVADVERLRIHLGVERWVVWGGSWGSTLALAYAEKHTQHVKALILRGIFTLRRKELLFFYQEGTSLLFPDYWEPYLAMIPEVERGDLMSAYHRRLTSDDPEVRVKFAKAWTTWEMATGRLFINEEQINKGEEPQFALAFARIENHYFVNGGWFTHDSQIIDEAHALEKANIPAVIVQGRYDLVCPPYSAWDLHKQWPSSELVWVPDAGHSANEPGTTSELVAAGEKFKDLV